MYDTVLRGSKLLELKALGVLKIANHLIYGYPLNFNVSYSSSADRIAQFNTQWVVVKHDLGYLPANMTLEMLDKNFSSSAISYKQTNSEIKNMITVIDQCLNTKTWAKINVVPGVNRLPSNLAVLTFADLGVMLKEERTDFQNELRQKINAVESQIANIRLTGKVSLLLDQTFPETYKWDELKNSIKNLFNSSNSENFAILRSFIVILTDLLSKLKAYQVRSAV
jgi:hypothetical protein